MKKTREWKRTMCSRRAHVMLTWLTGYWGRKDLHNDVRCASGGLARTSPSPSDPAGNGKPWRAGHIDPRTTHASSALDTWLERLSIQQRSMRGHGCRSYSPPSNSNGCSICQSCDRSSSTFLHHQCAPARALAMHHARALEKRQPPWAVAWSRCSLYSVIDACERAAWASAGLFWSNFSRTVGVQYQYLPTSFFFLQNKQQEKKGNHRPSR
jgi:hypothetical protein